MFAIFFWVGMFLAAVYAAYLFATGPDARGRMVVAAGIFWWVLILLLGLATYPFKG